MMPAPWWAVLPLFIALTPLGSQAPARPAPRPQPKAPAAAPDRAVPFRVGETLAFDVSWSTFLTAGTARIVVRERRPVGPSTAYHVVAEGQATGFVARLYHVYYKSDTELDSRSLLPHRASLYREEGQRRRTKVTRFDRAAGRAEFESTGADPGRVSLAVPAGSHDPLSALFAIRMLDMRPSLAVQIPVASNGRLYTVRVTVHGRETIQTPFGARAAWRITPAIQQVDEAGGEPRRIALWLSDDAQRVPLRVEADMPVGTFNLVLRQVGDQGGDR